MKKLITLLCSVAVLSILSPAYAQTQDTALARIDNSEKVKKTDVLPENRSIKTAEETRPDRVNASPEIKFILPEAREKNSKQFLLNNKVGPNGEEVFMEKNGYYYITPDGQKVRVKTSALKDKPKHS